MFILGILFSTYALKATGTNVFLCALVINIILLIIVTIIKEKKPQQD
ncbi:hypothetical protein HMPREF0497_0116 [Lentilactobacillus buchneri ATCC 11577]|uniref:Uncharacterized protein n=1 Tax=Lentilactobacillus hilgardii (strain ATCC 8290 / DSM 20176 / CCUG 30140 / JCM 1155 / KCTC 3500 / NBRC 15886 / NCIMB 8040 / NRRL B-1843 / 9) TaxID=1423757 RepID=C0XI34_LENH9|nr:hypothetical protein HMPREF0497_0116 [Lentilactobacillus buchneri ATCC 11577]EEI24972.1 hypothetical protein HMPREF0519_0895 [Lentilactobacillus hilgardii DSM 20176 = ATCC 8290]